MTALAPPGISIVIVTFVARSLRPSDWSRRAGGARRIRRCIQANRRVARVRGGGGIRRGRRSRGGSCSSARRRLGAGNGRELGSRLTVLAGDDEHDSSDQEQAEAEQREPQRRGRLLKRRRRVVVVVVIVLVAVSFFVRIAVATHGAAYFRFSGRGQADLRKIRVFPHLCRRFAGLTLLGRGP